jgi:hypothetical protein
MMVDSSTTYPARSRGRDTKKVVEKEIEWCPRLIEKTQ